MTPRYRKSWRTRGANSVDAGRLSALYAGLFNWFQRRDRPGLYHALYCAERDGQYITGD